MGLFSNIKQSIDKTPSVVIIRELLKHLQAAGLFDLDPAKMARALVDVLWEDRADLMDGKLGVKPNRIVTAALALAHGVGQTGVSRKSGALVVALGIILQQAHDPAVTQAFTRLDSELMEAINEAYLDAAGELGDKVGFDVHAAVSDAWLTWDASQSA